ncbi:MobA-like NTP transferase protein [Humitalea rosea]|uniref:MobA-like NTP transferase protein n=1 Tax=Humitalea rosea TaxID=990373 RepID=A0A2W7ITI5_9PROT|nr:glycosyltransferase family 2 protein [Humitalea rosea]PZW50514.1 MobA-like NTP transferase protein [Humitalea rosea]
MIVIPMAGQSRRFAEAGYSLPKYMLPLAGRSVFAHAVESFRACFVTHPFLFIARDIAGTGAFIAAECAALGIRQAEVQLLEAPTAGQAETVELGLREAAVAPGGPISIFNIDTFRPGFRFPAAPWWAGSDGYLEVFRGAGANWSYVRPSPGPEPLALETAEKRPISDLCCTGLYHFARAGDFLDALAQERAAPSAAELYVAPLYNHLIRAGARIHYDLVPQASVIFCGVPAEYEALLAGAAARP